MSQNELSIQDKIIKATVKEDLLNLYQGNYLIKSLVQLIPMYGSLIDTTLTTAYNNILLQRSREFFNELTLGKIELSPDIINSEDFLHAYFSTFKAALYTKQREKIRFLSRLLNSGFNSGIISKADEYDDYLKILEDLTLREIYILYTLYSYEEENPIQKGENDLQRTTRFWSEFENKIKSDLSINSSEIKGLINRINRTGCYLEFTGGYLSYSGGRGQTTGLFRSLVNLINLKDEDFVYFRKI